MSKLSASPSDNSSSERHNYINVDADNKFAAKIRSKTIIDNQHMTQEHKGSLTWYCIHTVRQIAKTIK